VRPTWRLGEGLASEPEAGLASDPDAGGSRAAERAALDPGVAGRQDRPVAGIDNGYLAGYRVRFDEAGADGRVRTGSLLRYASDIAWRHSEDLGFDRRWYTDQGRWWVVRSVELDVLAAIPMGSLLRLSTAVIGHRRIWARRRGEFRLPDGQLAAVSMVDWVMLDDRGRILRIPPDFGRVFPNAELDGEILRVPLPPSPESVATIELRVRPQDLDPMGHVNNAAYLDWIEEVVATSGGAKAVAGLPRRVAIEYAASAEPDEMLTAAAWPDGGGWAVRIRRPRDGADVVRARLG
jgi:medium-chain acyl-[acyl-carrier-protein] hydrolase